MCETPGKLHMHHIVKVDPIVFEIGGGAFKAPLPSRASRFSNIQNQIFSNTFSDDHLYEPLTSVP